MRGELRKVLCTRWSAALLAALVALNGVLFYRYCTQPQGDEDYTLPQLRAAYARSDAELQADYDAQWARLDAAEPLTDEVYDEIYLAMSLDEAVLTQRETVRSYPDYVRSLREEAEAKQRSGFFGAPDSFAGRSLRRAEAHYAHLEVLAPEPSFSGGITVLTDWRVTDGICAAGGAMAGLLLLTGEQAAGLLCLVRPTKNGRGTLFRRKFAALVAELAGLFVLTYGGNLAISAAVLGLGDLRRPVQAVIGLQGCPLPLTAGEYLLCVFAGKLLWLLAAETVFFLLCAYTDRAALALGSGFAVGALGLAMQKVPVLWLQSLSLTRLALMDAFLKDCVYLNLFGLPVSRFPAALVFCAAVTTGGYAAGRAVFCRKSAVPSVKNRAARLPLPSGAHTGPLRHEGYKLLVRGGLGAALVCLLAVQIVSTRAVKPPSSEREMYYRSYSERLSGPPTAEKDAFLDAENERFAALHAQLEQAAAQAGGDTFLLEQLTADTERQLRPEDTFREAEAQYRALLPGQSYVYASGYERLFGPVGARETLAYMGLLVFALLLGLSQTMAGETESGVDVLICAAGAQRAVLRRKLLLCALLLPAALAAAYLPRLIAVAYRYSLPLLTAPAAGLPIFRRMPPWLPLWGVLALAALARLAAAAAAGAGILALSARTKSTVYTLLIGCAVLLPVMLLILFQ